MYNRIGEIQSYLSHHDFSLAKRRLLDMSLDSGNAVILQCAIQWSQKYNAALLQQNSTNQEASAAFISEAEVLLNQLQDYQQAILHRAPQPLLIAQDIGKKYTKGTFSLKPMSLQIHTGSVSGVVGENGNGKTTLLRCLAGQLAQDTGTIEFSQLN